MMKTILVAAALIIYGNKFLITQRAKGELSGLWEFPGGKVESGETLAETIVREIKEELGVDVIAKNSLSQFVHEYPFAIIDLTLIECGLKETDQKIRSDGSHTGFEWIDISNIDAFSFAPLDKKIVIYLLEHRARIFKEASGN